MDIADNHIYQCYAEVTLVDDAVVQLWSHTIKLDVHCASNDDMQFLLLVTVKIILPLHRPKIWNLDDPEIKFYVIVGKFSQNYEILLV